MYAGFLLLKALWRALLEMWVYISVKKQVDKLEGLCFKCHCRVVVPARLGLCLSVVIRGTTAGLAKEMSLWDRLWLRIICCQICFAKLGERPVYCVGTRNIKNVLLKLGMLLSVLRNGSDFYANDLLVCLLNSTHVFFLHNSFNHIIFLQVHYSEKFSALSAGRLFVVSLKSVKISYLRIKILFISEFFIVSLLKTLALMSVQDYEQWKK